jgi:hypothetical protein
VGFEFSVVYLTKMLRVGFDVESCLFLLKLEFSLEIKKTIKYRNFMKVDIES